MSGWEIAREIFQTIGVAVATVIAIFKWIPLAWRCFMKFKHLRDKTWPLKITLKSAHLGDTSSIPILLIVLLIEPRKSTILGQCEIVYLPDDFKSTPRTPLENDYFQDWKIGEDLDKPRTYRLSFYPPKVKHGDEVQIQVESEGYDCESKPIKVT